MSDNNYTITAKRTRFFLTIALFIAVIVIELYLLTTPEAQNDFTLRIVIIALFGFVIFRYLSMPKDIRVDDELIYFVNWLGKEKMAYIKDLRRIVSRLGSVTIFTEDKVIRIASGFNDFKKFCDDMQKRNPQVDVIGVK